METETLNKRISKIEERQDNIITTLNILVERLNGLNLKAVISFDDLEIDNNVVEDDEIETEEIEEEDLI